MPRDKALSHERIIQAARNEFSEYGYDKASMRRIGKRCGLTAAALYRHFESKEAMFDALVRPAAEDLNDWLESHLPDPEAAVNVLAGEPGAEASGVIWRSVEVEMMKELVYPRMSEYSMLINRSRGSKYENFLNDFVEKEQKMLAPYLREAKGLGMDVRDISENEIHMLITAYCSALFEPVMHNYSLEDALLYLDTIEAFFMPGWRKLMGFA